MIEVKRISPTDAKAKLSTGALLVCAYESDALFARNHLDGAISLKRFETLVPAMEKNREIIFYCA
jgi:hypothetical protein